MVARHAWDVRFDGQWFLGREGQSQPKKGDDGQDSRQKASLAEQQTHLTGFFPMRISLDERQG
jgi:hypothetical protein